MLVGDILGAADGDIVDTVLGPALGTADELALGV